MPDATPLHHCLKNKQLKLNAFSGKDPAKGLFNTCTHRRGAHTLQPSFCKAGYGPVSVQCLNSTQVSTILMMVLEAVI